MSAAKVGFWLVCRARNRSLGGLVWTLQLDKSIVPPGTTTQNVVMKYDFFPIDKLRIRTERLELRLPTNAELVELGHRAIEGIHPDDQMPFAFPWSRKPPVELGRGLMQHHWNMLASWKPEKWALQLGVFFHGEPVGVQDLEARDFATVKEVDSASWLAREFQGQGIGTEMRAAILYLAFQGLGAEYANSGAFVGNHASVAVSAKNGYQHNGSSRMMVENKVRENVHFRLSREDWDASQVEVDLTGVEAAKPMFGL